MSKQLIILAGPTGVGKTDTSIALALALGTEIVSCDSRQFYRELSIGTAVPSAEQLAQVPHHLIGNKSIEDYYNVFMFEQDALQILSRLFSQHDTVLMVGGSGMYIDVMLNGIDDIPDPDPVIRQQCGQLYEQEGLDGLHRELWRLDPEFCQNTDMQNYKRLIRALEVCLQSGRPYSAHRVRKETVRPFAIKIIGFERPREELYQRIDQRVDMMFAAGLADEARAWQHLRHLNALNTVGYKELFAHFDGEYDLARAAELIQRNTRHYAKKQMSWLRRYENVTYLHPDAIGEVLAVIGR